MPGALFLHETTGETGARRSSLVAGSSPEPVQGLRRTQQKSGVEKRSVGGSSEIRIGQIPPQDWPFFVPGCVPLLPSATGDVQPGPLPAYETPFTAWVCSHHQSTGTFGPFSQRHGGQRGLRIHRGNRGSLMPLLGGHRRPVGTDPLPPPLSSPPTPEDPQRLGYRLPGALWRRVPRPAGLLRRCDAI